MIAAVRIIDIVTSDNDKKFEPAGRLAVTILELTQKNGGCLPQDLQTHGFSPDEVDKYWHLAHSLAAVELKLLKDQNLSCSKIARNHA